MKYIKIISFIIKVEVDENEARKAVMKTRPCVAKFHLSGQQWGNFCKFYRNNPTGILT